MDNVFNRRNAAVGFVTLKALSRYVEGKRRRTSRSSKIALYAALALVSFGILAGLAWFWKQHSAEVSEAVGEAGDVVGEATESADQLAEEAAAAAAEPVPAT